MSDTSDAGSSAADSFDLVVIGAGPGGYVAAIRAAQLGLKVACIDKATRFGGTCLRIGCIPSKAMLESSEQYELARDHLADHGVDVETVALNLPKMLARKNKVVDSLTMGIDGLFQKNGVEGIHGSAKLESATSVVVDLNDGGSRTLSAKTILIATGSVPISLPGVDLDGDRIGTSTEALSYEEVPEHLVVIGAGYIGLELGTVWRRLGSQVTVLEYLDRVLPGMDGEVAKEAHKLFKRQGLKFQLGTKVTGVTKTDTGCVVEVEGGDPIECDRVLVAVGRKPNTEGLGLEGVGVKLDERGRIATDDHFRTNVEGIYAIGDVVAGPMLAHKAEEEGIACVEGIKSGYAHINYDAIPGVVYTDPEIGAVGKTEEQLKEAGIPYRKGLFRFKANGRARALDSTDGFVKMLAHEETDRVLGIHIIGPRAGDLIAEAAVALEFGASAEDIARSSHAHPTLAEAVKEAALAVHGRPIHS